MTEGTPPPGGVRQPSPPFFQAAAVFYFLLAMGGVLWIGLERKSISLGIFFQPVSALGDVALGLVSAAALLLLWEGGRRTIPAVSELDQRLRGILLGITTSEAIALALLSGFAEEFFFRGAVQGSLGWLWATILFAAIHAGPDRIVGLWSVYALVAGGLFAALTEWRGTILCATVAHVVINGVQLVRLSHAPPDVSST